MTFASSTMANILSRPITDRLYRPRPASIRCRARWSRRLITVIEVATGKLVDKHVTGARDIELRHLAAGRLDRIFAIQARFGSDKQDAAQRVDDHAAYDFDQTTEPGLNYLGAATLKYDARAKTVTKMGDAKSTRLMRHGLSIRYDERHDEAIATYPSSHQLMLFDGATGAVAKRFDTSKIGLRYPCGITLLPDGRHYAVTGYWENMFVFELGTHRLVRDLAFTRCSSATAILLRRKRLEMTAWRPSWRNFRRKTNDK